MKKLIKSLGFTSLVVSGALGIGLVAANADASKDTERETTISDFAQTVDLQLAQGEVIDVSKPFSHNTHLGGKVAKRNDGKRLDCADCHKVTTPDGQCPKQEVRFPEHDACAKCHSANFYTPPLNLCQNCHTSNTFKKGNPLKDLGRQVTPRKAEFNHRLHLIAKGQKKKTGKKLDCKSCHKMKKGGKKVQHPSHQTCCQCHTDTKLAVNMTKCSSCHKTGGGRPVSKIHSFTHQKHHRTSPTGESLACKTCHINTKKSTKLKNLNIPPMQVCVECHNGEHAWHFSSCLKCHKEGTMAGPLPPSHPDPNTPPKGDKK